ncbi:LuxR C-terminal-related transcriptional regulator [Streptomyces halstedii]|uniref:LuxR C-terminal-related transcriptional regulator n=1 Tax=Streptomyces halstedii TaxID=1944 RepID=UPI00382BDEA2
MAQHVMTDVQAAITRAVQCLGEVPAIEGLAGAYDSHRWYGGPRSEWLSTPDEMNGRIAQVLREAASEMLTAQPGAPVDRDPEVLSRGMGSVLDLVGRGVAVRSIYNAAVHEHTLTRGHLVSVTEAGAEVATLREAFPRMVIIDGAHLFIDNHVMPNAKQNSGWHVYDRAAVAWAHASFEQLWARSARWQNVQAPGGVLTERQKMILRELDEGESQQGIGPRLGLAERTVTKELAAAKAAVGVRTVFQLMGWWGRQQGQ